MYTLGDRRRKAPQSLYAVTEPTAKRRLASSPYISSSASADSTRTAPGGVRYLLTHCLATAWVTKIRLEASAPTKQYGDKSSHGAVDSMAPCRLCSSALLIQNPFFILIVRDMPKSCDSDNGAVTGRAIML